MDDYTCGCGTSVVDAARHHAPIDENSDGVSFHDVNMIYALQVIAWADNG